MLKHLVLCVKQSTGTRRYRQRYRAGLVNQYITAQALHYQD